MQSWAEWDTEYLWQFHRMHQSWWKNYSGLSTYDHLRKPLLNSAQQIVAPLVCWVWLNWLCCWRLLRLRDESSASAWMVTAMSCVTCGAGRSPLAEHNSNVLEVLLSPLCQGPSPGAPVAGPGSGRVSQERSRAAGVCSLCSHTAGPAAAFHGGWMLSAAKLLRVSSGLWEGSGLTRQLLINSRAFFCFSQPPRFFWSHRHKDSLIPWGYMISLICSIKEVLVLRATEFCHLC